jgi:hypothetical protein
MHRFSRLPIIYVHAENLLGTQAEAELKPRLAFQVLGNNHQQPAVDGGGPGRRRKPYFKIRRGRERLTQKHEPDCESHSAHCSSVGQDDILDGILHRVGNPPHRYNRISVRILTWLLLTPLLPAQDHAQFTWQGEVDGIDILYLHADRLNVQAKEGAPVARQQYHFYDRLPESRQDARLEVREGRGFVHIIDQPRIENQYTLAVSIEDRQPGS